MKRIFIFILLALTTGVYAEAQQPERPAQQPAPETGEKFRIGMAGYTFKNFDLDKTLAAMQRDCPNHARPIVG